MKSKKAKSERCIYFKTYFLSLQNDENNTRTWYEIVWYVNINM